MIHINHDDSLFQIIEKIRNTKEDKIILFFPFGHGVLHNFLSLKILKTQAGYKDLTIITTDILSPKIGRKLGIRYLINQEQETAIKNSKEYILKHNFSFHQLFFYESKRIIKSTSQKILSFIKTLYCKENIQKIKQSKLGMASIIFTLSFLLFAFIFYVSIHKTTIFITPEIEINIKAKNLTYTSRPLIEDENFIPLQKISTTYSLTKSYQSQEIDYWQTSLASGKVEFINELREPISLRPNTRLLSSDNILFETLQWVSIPTAEYDANGQLIPGTTIVEVQAKPFDQEGIFTGERGNIENELFILPGLTNNRDRIYAKSIEAFTWWTNEYSYKIGENDIENAKNNLQGILRQDGLKKLQMLLNEKNNTNNSQYDFLPVSGVIFYDSEEITPLNNAQAGDSLNNFEMEGTISLSTYIYDKQKVLNILENDVKSELLDSQDLVFLNQNSLRVSNIINRDTTEYFEIRATTDIEIGIGFNFENSENNYIQKLKSRVAGLDNTETYNILIEDQEIRDLSIEHSPFFMKNMAKNIENISIKTQK